MASSCLPTVATSSTVRAEADAHAAAGACWLGQPLGSIWPRPSTWGRRCLLLSQAAILVAWLSATLNPRSIPPLAALPAGPEFELSARVPDPWRLVRAYNQSAATLNLLRGFATGGYAGLDRVTKWSLDFMKVGGGAAGRGDRKVGGVVAGRGDRKVETMGTGGLPWRVQPGPQPHITFR